MKGKLMISAALAAFAVVAGAQQVGFYSDGRPERIFRPVSGVSSLDAKFLKEAAFGNRFEVESSKLAAANGSSPFVQEFAKEMISEHMAAQDEDVDTAKLKNVSMDADLPSSLESKLNELRGLHGDKFDNAYLSAQKAGHEDAIDLFKREIRYGHDQDIKAFAVKMLPMIELHFKMILSGKTMMGDTKADHGM
jgi:putative membrane protein